jgi:hypothetical protein
LPIFPQKKKRKKKRKKKEKKKKRKEKKPALKQRGYHRTSKHTLVWEGTIHSLHTNTHKTSNKMVHLDNTKIYIH